MAQTVGTFFELGSSNAMECLTRTGLDYAIIDTEHGCFSEEHIADYIRAAENGGLLPYVRISDIHRPYVLHMLDIGARGLIVPNITSVDQVQEVVSHAKFPPLGKRGYCPTRTSGWGADEWAFNVAHYMEENNRKCLVIPQCETLEALNQIEEIAAIPGVDGIFVGPCDLSIAMGIPLQLDSPILAAAIERILKACQLHHKQSYIFTSNPKDAKMYLKKGFDSVALGLDTSVLTHAYQEMIHACCMR